jgi:hypothetical protein
MFKKFWCELNIIRTNLLARKREGAQHKMQKLRHIVELVSMQKI